MTPIYHLPAVHGDLAWEKDDGMGARKAGNKQSKGRGLDSTIPRYSIIHRSPHEADRCTKRIDRGLNRREGMPANSIGQTVQGHSFVDGPRGVYKRVELDAGTRQPQIGYNGGSRNRGPYTKGDEDDGVKLVGIQPGQMFISLQNDIDINPEDARHVFGLGGTDTGGGVLLSSCAGNTLYLISIGKGLSKNASCFLF